MEAMKKLGLKFVDKRFNGFNLKTINFPPVSAWLQDEEKNRLRRKSVSEQEKVANNQITRQDIKYPVSIVIIIYYSRSRI